MIRYNGVKIFYFGFSVVMYEYIINLVHKLSYSPI